MDKSHILSAQGTSHCQERCWMSVPFTSQHQNTRTRSTWAVGDSQDRRILHLNLAWNGEKVRKHDPFSSLQFWVAQGTKNTASNFKHHVFSMCDPPTSQCSFECSNNIKIYSYISNITLFDHIYIIYIYMCVYVVKLSGKLCFLHGLPLSPTSARVAQAVWDHRPWRLFRCASPNNHHPPGSLPGYGIYGVQLCRKVRPANYYMSLLAAICQQQTSMQDNWFPSTLSLITLAHLEGRNG